MGATDTANNAAKNLKDKEAKDLAKKKSESFNFSNFFMLLRQVPGMISKVLEDPGKFVEDNVKQSNGKDAKPSKSADSSGMAKDLEKVSSQLKHYSPTMYMALVIVLAVAKKLDKHLSEDKNKALGSAEQVKNVATPNNSLESVKQSEEISTPNKAPELVQSGDNVSTPNNTPESVNPVKNVSMSNETSEPVTSVESVHAPIETIQPVVQVNELSEDELEEDSMPALESVTRDGDVETTTTQNWMDNSGASLKAGNTQHREIEDEDNVPVAKKIAEGLAQEHGVTLTKNEVDEENGGLDIAVEQDSGGDHAGFTQDLNESFKVLDGKESTSIRPAMSSFVNKHKEEYEDKQQEDRSSGMAPTLAAA